MFRTNLKIAIRNIAKHKYFSLITAFGLALGMSVSLLLISFYSYVSSFDDFHAQKERIYRVISTREKEGTKKGFASAPSALKNKLEDESGDIREITRINASFHGDVVTDKIDIPIEGYYVDANFFSVFDFEMTRGNPVNALLKPNSIVLTESVARKLEVSGDLLGKIFEIDGLGNFEVTGIIKDQKQTHFMFEALVSFSTLPPKIQGEESYPDQWTSYTNQYIYLLVDDPSNKENIQRLLNGIANKVNSQSNDTKVMFNLQALGDITPGPDLENSLGPDSDNTLIVVFGTICLLILLPACFNYANLSIARTLKRSKEIGLRKTLGGAKMQIFAQFITETVAIVVLALIGAVLIFLMIRPEFEDMMPGSWLDLSLTWQMLVMFLLFAVATGFLTGVVPALYFAGLNPIQALKGKSNAKGFSRMRARKVLIVFQFALSFCFIVLLIVFSRQYRSNLNFDYGFNTNNILDVKLQGVNHAILRSEFSRIHAVQDVSMSSDILGLSYSSTFARERTGVDSLKVFQLFCDPHYVNNMGLHLVAGKNFPTDLVQRERHILVNEEFLRARQIMHPNEALGRTFIVEGKELEVIGVLKNFHFAPLQEPIKSFFLRTDPSHYSYANLKVASNDMHATLADMEKKWSALSARKFDGRFFDDEMEEMYHFYTALIKMIGFLGLVAISITLLGLLGMVIYMIEPRKKEVGVRKVFGANEASITLLLSRDFLTLMAWSIGFAIPVSTLLIDDFLSELQYYRISLNVWDILVSLVIFLSIGLGTIASQTRKAARANPIDALRYE
jgi:putative ABC transport system permease protein